MEVCHFLSDSNNKMQSVIALSHDLRFRFSFDIREEVLFPIV